MGALQRAGVLAFGFAALQFTAACSNNTSEQPGSLAGSEGGEGATETNATRPVCHDDSECPEGVACIRSDSDAGVGQCDVPTSEGAAGGTCLAGSGDCDNLGPADGPGGGGAPGLCQSDDECPGACLIEPGEDTGVCDG